MLHEECGVFGIYGHENAAEIACLGLYALQHRGDESAGIVAADGVTMRQHRGLGRISEVFADPSIVEDLKGHLAVGHNRYSTTGSTLVMNTQPFVGNCRDGPLAVAHNGNLVNTSSLRRELQEMGALFQTTMDSEVFVHLAARSRAPDVVDRIVDALSQVRGAYSAVFATKDRLIVARDPYGFRPLCLGRLNGAWIAASESCAFDLVTARYIRDVTPGEVIVIQGDQLRSLHPFECSRRAHCIFEYIYFSRPDSRIFGDYVDKTRRKFGRQLAAEHPADADIVISVPDSSNTAAMGYAQASGIKLEIGLIRNHYIGRTFIQPSQPMREFGSRIKYNTVGGVLKDKRVVVIEDSVVRGTTMRHLTQMIRQAGAREVHLRVSSPPIILPCFYGVDFQTSDELIASSRTVEEIRDELGLDSLGYLSIEGMLASAPNSEEDYCTACLSGEYPVPIEEPVEKLSLEKMIA